MTAMAQKWINVIIKSGKNNQFVIFVRLLFVFSMIACVVVLYETSSDRGALIIELIRYSLFAFVCNFGLYFITTRAARRNRVLATFIYLPSIFVSPFSCGYMLGDSNLFVMAFFLCSLFIYYWFNPWRKNV